MDTDDFAPLVEYLQSEGCSGEEIDKILRMLSEHDKRAVRESIFDSIASGSFNLKAIIAAAREQP